MTNWTRVHLWVDILDQTGVYQKYTLYPFSRQSFHSDKNGFSRFCFWCPGPADQSDPISLTHAWQVYKQKLLRLTIINSFSALSSGALAVLIIPTGPLSLFRQLPISLGHN